MTIEIRPVRPDELSTVQKLDAEIFAELFTRLTGKHTPATLREREYFDIWSQTDPEGALVAIEDGEIVGLNFCHARGRSGWIGPLAVCVGHQGQGIGKLLLERGVEYLETSGCEHIGLDTFANNPVSVSLYLKAGLQICGAFVSVQLPMDEIGAAGDIGSHFEVSLITSRDLPLIVEAQERATGFDRTPDFEFCLDWERAAGFKLCQRDELVGCVFCLCKKNWAMVASMYLAQAVHIPEGAAALLQPCIDFARQLGCHGVTVTATGHDTRLLQYLYTRGFRTSRTMIRMFLQPPAADGPQRPLCTPLASEKG